MSHSSPSTNLEPYLTPDFDILTCAESFVLKRLGTDDDVQDVAYNLSVLESMQPPLDQAKVKHEVREYIDGAKKSEDFTQEGRMYYETIEIMAKYDFHC